MAKYEVLSRLYRNSEKKSYLPGEIVEYNDPKAAKILMDLGVIKPVRKQREVEEEQDNGTDNS